MTRRLRMLLDWYSERQRLAIHLLCLGARPCFLEPNSVRRWRVEVCAAGSWERAMVARVEAAEREWWRYAK